jgi:hypothetical protein
MINVYSIIVEVLREARMLRLTSTVICMHADLLRYQCVLGALALYTIGYTGVRGVAQLLDAWQENPMTFCLARAKYAITENSNAESAVSAVSQLDVREPDPSRPYPLTWTLSIPRLPWTAYTSLVHTASSSDINTQQRHENTRHGYCICHANL